MNIVSGDLIKMAHQGHFDVIGHGCNCQNIMGAGLALQMKKSFPDLFKIDASYHEENRMFPINMMGNYSSFYYWENDDDPAFEILNCYTQLYPGLNSHGCSIPLDYIALTCCMRKVNFRFAGKRIGLPWIGCGLAGGDTEVVRGILDHALTDMVVTIVQYENNKSTSGPMVAAGLGDAPKFREAIDTFRAAGTGKSNLAANNGGGEGWHSGDLDEGTWKPEDMGDFKGYGE